MSTALIGIRSGRPAAIRFWAQSAHYKREKALQSLLQCLWPFKPHFNATNACRYSTGKRVRRDLRLGTQEAPKYDGFSPERLAKMLASTNGKITPLIEEIVLKNDVLALFRLIDCFEKEHTPYLILCLEALIDMLGNRTRRPLIEKSVDLLLKRNVFIANASPERKSRVKARFRAIVIKLMQQHFQAFAETLKHLLQSDHKVVDGLTLHVLEVMSIQREFNDQLVHNICELVRFREAYQLYRPSDLVLAVDACITAKRFSAAVTLYNDYRDRSNREHIILGAVLGAQPHLGPVFSRIFLECVGNVRRGDPMDEEFLDMIHEMGTTLNKLNPTNLQLFIEDAFFLKDSVYFTSTGLVMLAAVTAASGLAGTADRIAAHAEALDLPESDKALIKQYQTEANSRAGKLAVVERTLNEKLWNQSELTEQDLIDLLRACRLKGAVRTAIQWWSRWQNSATPTSTVLYNAYISALIRTSGTRAWSIFEKMPNKSINSDTLDILLASAVRYDQHEKIELLSQKRDELGFEKSPSWIYHMMCYYQRKQDTRSLEREFSSIRFSWKLEPRHFYPMVQNCIHFKNISRAEKLLEMYLEMGFYAEYRYYGLSMEVIGLRADYDPKLAFDTALASLDSLESYMKFRKNDNEVGPFSTTMYNGILASLMEHRRFADCQTLIKRMLDSSADLNTYFRKIELESCSGDHRTALGTWSLAYSRLKEGDTSKNYYILRHNRFNYEDMIVAVIQSLCACFRYAALLQMPERLSEINLGLTPRAWRYYFQGLLAATQNKEISGQVYLQLLAISEKLMIDYNFKSKRGPLRQHEFHMRKAMSRKTFNMLADSMSDMIAYVADTKGLSLGKAEKMLRQEFPKTVPAALWLSRKKRTTSAAETEATVDSNDAALAVVDGVAGPEASELSKAEPEPVQGEADAKTEPEIKTDHEPDLKSENSDKTP